MLITWVGKTWQECRLCCVLLSQPRLFLTDRHMSQATMTTVESTFCVLLDEAVAQRHDRDTRKDLPRKQTPAVTEARLLTSELAARPAQL